MQKTVPAVSDTTVGVGAISLGSLGVFVEYANAFLVICHIILAIGGIYFLFRRLKNMPKDTKNG